MHYYTCCVCKKQVPTDNPNTAKRYCAECRREVRRRCMQRSRECMQKRYGVSNAAYLPKVLEQRKASKFWISPEHANKLIGPVNDTATAVMLMSIISMLNIPYETDYVIEGITYTVYLPTYKTLIRVSTSLNDHIYKHPGAAYHYNMTRVAEAHGFRCIHIFDWDSFEKIYMMFLPKTRIYARKCTVEPLDRPICDMFLNMYHLQGACTQQSARYGLYYDNKLVQVMVFSKSRFAKKFEWELVRMCTDPELIVVGGASKLFKRFIQDHSPTSIISYCDASKFQGQVYLNMGMKHKETIVASKVWCKGAKKVADRHVTASGYNALFHTNFGKDCNYRELMLQNGWLPIYDCGQYSYAWHIEGEEAQ